MPDHDETTLELSGQRLRLVRHPTDLAVVGESAVLEAPEVRQQTRLTPAVTRLEAGNAEERDHLLARARRDSVAQPIYQVEGTGEEIIVDDHLLLEIVGDDRITLGDLAREHHLVVEGEVAGAHVLRLTPETGIDAVELAGRLARRPGVLSCRPQILTEHQRHGGPRFPR